MSKPTLKENHIARSGLTLIESLLTFRSTRESHWLRHKSIHARIFKLDRTRSRRCVHVERATHDRVWMQVQGVDSVGRHHVHPHGNELEGATLKIPCLLSRKHGHMTIQEFGEIRKVWRLLVKSVERTIGCEPVSIVFPRPLNAVFIDLSEYQRFASEILSELIKSSAGGQAVLVNKSGEESEKCHSPPLPRKSAAVQSFVIFFDQRSGSRFRSRLDATKCIEAFGPWAHRDANP